MYIIHKIHYNLLFCAKINNNKISTFRYSVMGGAKFAIITLQLQCIFLKEKKLLF